MVAETSDPPPPTPWCFKIRLPRPLWIGAAAVVLIVGAIGLQVGVPIFRRLSDSAVTDGDLANLL
jgi:hypothetical protein